MRPVSRRTFLEQGSAIAVAGHLLGARPGWAGANDRIRVAVIGINGRGQDHIEGFHSLPGVEVVTLCDIDEQVLAERSRTFEERYGRPVRKEIDLRRVLDDRAVDAVSIATPNHWHSLAAIWACQAGKDVYVEKPGSHNLFEGRRMVEAARKYGRIVQHGVQLRSSPAVREAVALLRRGVIGDVYMARGLCFRWRGSIGRKPAEPVPPHIHYDLWLGPAQERPFSRNLVHYNWHWHWDFGNGDLGNQGVHQTDMCLWGLGIDTLPRQIRATGGKFLWDDDKETPELLSCLYTYPDQRKMIQFEVRPWCTNDEAGAGVGNIFYGRDGFLVIDGYSRYATFLGEKKEPGPRGEAEGDHFANFIEAVRARDASLVNGPVETAHLASALAHLGNISYRLGRKLEFDPEAERFVADTEADAMLSRDYRPPYVVPDRV